MDLTIFGGYYPDILKRQGREERFFSIYPQVTKELRISKENGKPAHKLFTQIVLQNPRCFFIINDRIKSVPDYRKCCENSPNKRKQGEEIWKKR